jgi:hypothetical protein
MSKKIKIKISESTAYSLWDSDENTLVGVIVKKPTENEGDEIDVTETVRDMIREHNNAYSVEFESVVLPYDNIVVLSSDGFGKVEVNASILQSDAEGEQPDLRTYEIYPISAY